MVIVTCKNNIINIHYKVETLQLDIIIFTQIHIKLLENSIESTKPCPERRLRWYKICRDQHTKWEDSPKQQNQEVVQ